MARRYEQGIYQIKNKDKYLGKSDPRYLSSFEEEVWKYCDRSPHILKWGAEIVVVPYQSDVKGRKSRYIVDLYLEYKDKDGQKQSLLVEIKPKSQTKPPVDSPRKKKETFITESLTWANNLEKWRAAYDYAAQRGWKFTIWTEDHIFGGVFNRRS